MKPDGAKTPSGFCFHARAIWFFNVEQVSRESVSPQMILPQVHSIEEIPSGVIWTNEHCPVAASQNKVPRRTIFVLVLSGKVKLKLADFNPALTGTSCSSPFLNFTSVT